MRRKYRRIYAFSLILVFIIIAPLLVLYASGFRYDFSEKKIIKTGVLSVESDPRGAIITLNGEKTNNKTPIVIKNLFPGEYNVKIEKDGYYQWEKTLTVFANQSTTTSRVGLIKSSAATLVTENKVSNTVFSPNNSYLAYLTGGANSETEMVVKQQNTLRTVLEVKNITVDNQLVFSNNENFVLIQDADNNNLRIISVSGRYDVLLKDITNFPVYKIFESGSLSTVYAITENGLNKINLEKNSIELITTGSIQDAILFEGYIYYIQNSNQPSLIKLDLNTGSPEEISTFTGSRDYRIFDIRKNYIAVQNIAKKELTLVKIQNPFSITINKINPNVAGFSWSPDYVKLLVFNDYELWIYNPELNQQDLIIRSSSKIKSAFWSPDGKWIVYSNEGFIKAIELDGRGKRNTLDLAQSDLIPFAINTNTKVMFYHDSLQNLFMKQLQ